MFGLIGLVNKYYVTTTIDSQIHIKVLISSRKVSQKRLKNRKKVDKKTWKEKEILEDTLRLFG